MGSDRKPQYAFIVEQADSHSYTASNATNSGDFYGHVVIGDQTYEFGTQPEAETVAGEEAFVSWEGPLGIIGHATADKRYLMPGEILARELPLPLNVQMRTAEGHDESENAGRIETLAHIPKTDLDEETLAEFHLEQIPDEAIVIWGTGTFDDSPASAEARRMIANGYGVSLDLPPDRIAALDPETFQEIAPEEIEMDLALSGHYVTGIGGKVAGVTVVNVPAFEEASIKILEDTVLVASGFGLRLKSALSPGYVPGLIVDGDEIIGLATGKKSAAFAVVAGGELAKPSPDYFQNPNFLRLTPLTIGEPDSAGWTPVFGHLADWDGCHTGFTQICVPPFRSQSNYAYFNVGEILCEGDERIPVGKLMFSREAGVGHAPTTREYGAQEASQWYDDSTKVAGFVRAGSDRYGTWLAGVLAPGLSEEDLVMLRANPPSGDWRPIPGKPGSELVAAFSVPVPGFPIPRMMVASAADGGLTIISGPLDVTPGPRAVLRQMETLKRRRKKWAMTHDDAA